MSRKLNYIFAILGLLLLHTIAVAQFQYENQPGNFNFYVLALSWSPSYCEIIRKHGPSYWQQCGARPYSFVVHGLWPQHEGGFPKYCIEPPPRLNRHIVSSMLDLMPAPKLIYHEWDQHGTCSGLSPLDYFKTIRKAREMIKIPPEFVSPRKAIIISPEKIEEAFIRSNPGLIRDAIAVTCNRHRLSEVRICLTKDFKFLSCPKIRSRACRREEVIMPPLRGDDLSVHH